MPITLSEVVRLCLNETFLSDRKLIQDLIAHSKHPCVAYFPPL